jgi:hypothetical protein
MCNPLKDFIFCEYYIHRYSSHYENLQFLNYCKFLEIKCKCPKEKNKFNRYKWKTNPKKIQESEVFNGNNHYDGFANL